jgi:hypothetical protein
MSGVLTRMANALWSSGVAWLERVWGRAAPDAPERVYDERRCTGYHYWTSCRGSRGSASYIRIGNSCWSMMKESSISAQKLAMCRVLSIPKPFEPLASKIAQFREDFHLIVVRVESWRGVACGSLGVASNAPPGLQDRRSADSPIRVICGCGSAAVFFELKATITWQKARLSEWHKRCSQPLRTPAARPFPVAL